MLATAGGVAFFALMAIFPALATIVSLYGLFADPHAIRALDILAGVVPASVIGLLKQHILSLAENHISTLNIAFLIGFLVSMWSANSGVSALFDALNVVHGSKETRGLLQFYTRTLAITVGSVIYGVLVLIGVLPHVFTLVGEPTPDSLAAFFRWPVTLFIVMIGLSIVYRIGPSRSDARWRWVVVGQCACRRPVGRGVHDLHLVCRGIQQLQSNLWLLGSRRGFMTWIWLSVVIVLICAELDAAFEKRRFRGPKGALSRIERLEFVGRGTPTEFCLVVYRDLRCFGEVHHR